MQYFIFNFVWTQAIVAQISNVWCQMNALGVQGSDPLKTEALD